MIVHDFKKPLYIFASKEKKQKESRRWNFPFMVKSDTYWDIFEIRWSLF